MTVYDENLLERSRIQWQFGDWHSLSQINCEDLNHHPDRANIALLAAAGRLQTGQNAEARKFIHLAQEWGLRKKILSQILIAGVHNSLGRVAAIAGQERRALEHFRKSISTGMPASETNLLTKARAGYQIASLDIPLAKNLEGRMHILQHSLINSPNTAVNKKNTTAKKSHGYSDIDDMLNDLKPFFSGKAITYVDVGAYVGEVFLKIHESNAINIREAHLYEPNPASFKILKENLEKCRVSSLHVYNFAISSQTGEKQFISGGSMTKMMQVNVDLIKTTGIFSAQSYTLDDLVSTYTDAHIDLLKIDVEGAEIEVLYGANKVLREQRIDVIYIEAGLNRQGTQQTYLANLDTMLQDYGYRIFRIYEQMNEWMKNSPLLRRCNCAYMSSRFVDANPLKKTQELAKIRQEVADLKQQLSERK